VVESQFEVILHGASHVLALRLTSVRAANKYLVETLQDFLSQSSGNFSLDHQEKRKKLKEIKESCL